MLSLGLGVAMTALVGATQAQPQPDLALAVELVEQSYCSVGDGTYLGSFEVRPVYTNRGTADYVLALRTARPAGVTVVPVGPRAGDPGPSTAPGREPMQIDEIATLRPGWAVAGSAHGRFTVRVALNDSRPETLAPGDYRARFHIDMMARQVGPSQPGQHGAAFPWMRLSTDPIPLTITAPGQVQECGDGR